MMDSCARDQALQERVPTRIGLAKLSKMSFDGTDLGPLWYDLLQRVAKDGLNTAAIMDMSVIAQLLGDQISGLALQAGALDIQRLYRSPCSSSSPRLRVLALAAATDMGGNTPLEFLLEDSEIELITLYVVPGMPLPQPLPAHDIAMVVAPVSKSVSDTLSEITQLVKTWPKPVINLPQNIFQLDRDRLHVLLKSAPGISIPTTARLSRKNLLEIAHNGGLLRDGITDGGFPLIVRPIDGHAGLGLAKLELASDIDAYLSQRPEADFFISPYVDYSGTDGLFRKYRIVFVDGRPYACHMAISDQWKIWYYNADMAQCAARRAEEAQFMANFEGEFASRHSVALAETARRIDLEYFGIDCAETKDGKLLIFEADNAMIVHNMDPVDVFPYKAPQMRKIFNSFAAMLYRHAHGAQACAA
jgi:glutathione synthase/RimK-type ligase-like ATP-grasp enzyme